jgi:uncharacterized protein (DUF983 family)
MQVLAAVFMLLGALFVVITFTPFINEDFVRGRPWWLHILIWSPITTLMLVLAFKCNSRGQ